MLVHGKCALEHDITVLAPRICLGQAGTAEDHTHTYTHTRTHTHTQTHRHTCSTCAGSTSASKCAASNRHKGSAGACFNRDASSITPANVWLATGSAICRDRRHGVPGTDVRNWGGDGAGGAAACGVNAF
eukprot:1161524-Pelagomonas_calceolata.AAC.8